MAIAQVAHVEAGSTGGSAITTGSIDTTGATLLVALVGSYAPDGAATVTDSKGNTWTRRTQFNSTDARVQVSYCVPSSVGSGHTFTVTPAGTGYPGVVILAFSGTDTSTPFDKDTGKGNNNPAVQPDAAITPTNDNALVITALAWENTGTPTVNESYDAPTVQTFSSGNHLGCTVARWIQTNKTATQPTWTFTGAGDGAMTVIVFNAGASGTAYTIDATAGSYAATGSTDTGNLARLTNGAAGSYAITGVDFTPIADYALNAVAGQYDVSGAIILTPAQAYLLSLAAGSYAHTGSDTGAAAWLCSALAGSYALTGRLANLHGPHDVVGSAALARTRR
jgi:hypothetical protein